MEHATLAKSCQQGFGDLTDEEWAIINMVHPADAQKSNQYSQCCDAHTEGRMPLVCDAKPRRCDMAEYYIGDSKCLNETVPNASWTVEITSCRGAGLQLEILSVFNIDTRTCLAVSAYSNWRFLNVVETLDQVSLNSGYPRTVYLVGDRCSFLDLCEWACVHNVDLRVAVTMQHHIAERRLPYALAAIEQQYNLNDGWPVGLASKLLATMNSKQAKCGPWALARLRHSAQRK